MRFIEFVPDVILQNNDIFFLKPIFAPSGVSYGHIYPNEDRCNIWGALTLALLERGVFTRLMCETAPAKLSLFIS